MCCVVCAGNVRVTRLLGAKKVLAEEFNPKHTHRNRCRISTLNTLTHSLTHTHTHTHTGIDASGAWCKIGDHLNPFYPMHTDRS